MEQPVRCARCGDAASPDVRATIPLCIPCVRRAYENAVGNTFGLLREKAIEIAPGRWRLAREIDCGFEGWLCPHVHSSEQEALDCDTDRESLLGPLT